MKRIVTIIALYLLGCSTANAQTPINPQDSIALSGVWEDFRQAFSEKDLPRLKALSASQIYCSECYDNTQQEKERNEQLMQTGKWEKFMEQAYYVPLTKFLQEDVAVVSEYTGSRVKNQPYQIYNDEANKTLFTKKLKKKQLSNPVHCYSVIISFIEPSKEFDGLQTVFTFVKTKKGFLFCGYGTVP